MKVLLSWLRDFVDVPGTAEEIGHRMSLRGLALESVEYVPAFAPTEGQSATAGAMAREDGVGPSESDAVLDFEVTANRPDCLSVLGIAREIATVYGLPLRVPGPDAAGRLRTPALKAVAADAVGVAVRIEAPDLCGRYAASRVRVTPGPSPAWMQARLRALGLRPISNIVDITNYVLLELGQPLHAFDATRLAESTIVVRRARPGETIVTLDGKARTLEPEMLVIADAREASAVAGVMGGAASEVSTATTDVVLESAWFAPASVRATSKKLGLRTDASYRFERGADRDGTVRAMARAVALLGLCDAGTADGTVVDEVAAPWTPAALNLTARQIDGLLGMPVPADAVERILTSLGFEVRTLGGWQAMVPEAPAPVGAPGSSWQVTVPGWRVDIARPVDLIEEIGRHHGFEHLPATFPGVQQAPPPSDPRLARDRRVRRTLLAAGFSEAVTFAFIEERAALPFAAESAAADGASPALLRLANPLSEKFAVMRPSLLPGLVEAVGHNRRRERRDVRLFEIGTRFAADGEVRAAAAAWTGLATPDHWSGHRRDVDFFDVKGLVEHVAAALEVSIELRAARLPFLVDGRAATVHAGDTPVGTVGLLAAEVARALGVPDGDAVYVAELDLDRLSAHAPAGVRRARPLPRHPSVTRDLSILVDDTLSAESVRGTIRAAAPDTLTGVREFDRYHGRGIPDGKVSLSLRLTFQAADRTLTDEEVQAAMDAITIRLRTALDAVQR